MDYEESESEIENERESEEQDTLEIEDEDLEEGAELSEEPIAALDVKEKDRQVVRHSLEVRRAIEEHMERKRLHKELDYLFDDDFATGDGAH